MVASFMPSIAFAYPTTHSCTWKAEWEEVNVKDGKVLASVANTCDYDTVRAHRCTVPGCDKYDEATAVVITEGPQHTWDAGTPKTSCKETWKEYVCTKCGEVKREDLTAVASPKEHVWSTSRTKVVKAATCTNNKIVAYECTNTDCDEIKDPVEVPGSMLKHDMAVATKNKDTGDYTFASPSGTPITPSAAGGSGANYKVFLHAATCQNDKYYEVKCKNCNTKEKYVVDGSVLPHSYTKEVTVAPTCTTDGTITMYCATPGCLEHKDSVENGKALGHDFKNGTKVDAKSKDATCTEAGYTVTKCAKCNAEEKVDVPAKGHTFAKTRTQVSAPTCTEDAVYAYACTAAGCNAYSDPVVMAGTATGHTPSVWKFTRACDEEAYAVKDCNVCHEVLERRALTAEDKMAGGIAYNQDLSPMGHGYELSKIIDATCSEAGKRIYTCWYCDKTKEETIAKLPHTIVNDAAVAATSTKTGLTAGQHCSVCNEVVTAQKVTVAKAKAPTVKAGKKKLTVTASKVTGATKYQVAYRQSGKSWKYATASTKNAQTIKSLKSGKKYYVKVRTISGSVKGAWSSTKSVKVK